MTLNFGQGLFPPRREFIASFNFSEITSGLGLKKFYFTKAENNLNIENILTDIILNSSKGQEETVVIENTTINFDTSEFNFARTIQGEAYFQCEAKSSSSSTGDKISIKIQKVDKDGSTTTDISSEISTNNITSTTQTKYLIKVPLTQTNIKKGEKLRTVVKLNELGSGTTLTFYHGGMDSFILIPFKIPI